MEHNQGTELEKTFPKFVLALKLGQLLCVPASLLVTMTILEGPEIKTTIVMRFHLLSTEEKKKGGLISAEISNLVSSIFKREK